MAPWQYACPRGHRAIELGRDRAWCQSCRRNGERSAFDRDELVDLTDPTDRGAVSA